MALSKARLIGVVVLAGCATPVPPPPRAAPVEVTPPVATAETTTTTEDVPPPETGPIRVELLASPACVLQGPWRGRKWQTDMLVRPGGPAFAVVSGGKGRLHFPAGPRPATQGLELEADGISVTGHIDSGASDLRATKAFWLSGFVLPTPFTLLEWTEAARGEITVTAAAPARLEVLAPPLSAIAPCEDVAATMGAFSAADAIDGFKKAKVRQLVTARPVDIARTPGGPPVARAHATGGSDEVSLLDVRGGNSRIAWNVASLMVVGWVKSADIHVPGTGVGFGSGHGRLGAPHYTGDYKKVVCSIDVDLVAEIGEARFLTGRIRAGTVLELSSTNERFTSVRVRSQLIVPSEDARWVVPNPDLEGCQSPP